MIRNLSASALQRFIRDKKEAEYMIIDVRRHEEYRLDHIPGSVNIPLAEIQFDPYMFEEDKKLIFYCRSGSRSKVAAIFVAETDYPDGQLYNLKGGMLEYTGEILLEYPRVDLFPKDTSPADAMERAIDLEKGAFIFYGKAKEAFRGTELYEVVAKMTRAEISHAKAVYNMMQKIQGSEMDFDMFFKTCKGEVLEGGKSIDEVKVLFEKQSRTSCLDILDFAIELEYCAYDLYKVMANDTSDAPLKEMFLTLAQAEKKHLEKIIQSLELCDITS